MKKNLILGDLNVSVKENQMKFFCDTYGLRNLIKQRKCYKNSDNPTCVDLVLTNSPRSFYSTCVC